MPALHCEPASFAVSPGVRIEDLAGAWVAFSPRSGETLILNDESAAILEILAEEARGAEDVCAVLRSDGGAGQPDLNILVRGGLARLAEAGLVQEVSPALEPLA